MSDKQQGLSYRDAGVDIDAGNALVERIKPMVARTRRPEVLAGLGGFGGLFRLPTDRYKEPVLVSGTDGVGTKLMLAQQLNQHDTIGIDLVAMCVNDIVVSGAEPLFFLDYFACGKLDVDTAAAVVQGITDGCSQAGCALVGGETAEMPDMYAPGEYDLAGFTVGVVERSAMLTENLVQEGDVVVGLTSSGVHSNGFSLVRKVIDRAGVDLGFGLEGRTLGDRLLEPTRIYVKAALDILAAARPHGFAHITGGGLSENIIRSIPDALGIEIDLDAWERGPLFDWLQSAGGISDSEMLRTFNCGIGFTVICSSDAVDATLEISQRHDIDAQVIGRIVRTEEQRVRYL